jgi:CxxC motif-containing protein
VKTVAPVPQHRVLASSQALAGARLHAPVRLGGAVATDVAGTGVDVVATRDMPAVTAQSLPA